MPDHHTAARPSAAAGYRPVLIFAVLGAVSGLAGTFGLEIGISSRNGFGLSMIPTGIWFCAVVAAAVTWLGRATPSGAAVAILTTFAGWEAAVNLSLLLLDPLYKHGQGNAGLAVIGLFCGAVGSLFTWAGAAWAVPALRRRSSAVLVVVAGTLLGALLGATDEWRNPYPLLIPWQAAVAATLAHGLVRARSPLPVLTGRGSG